MVLPLELVELLYHANRYDKVKFPDSIEYVHDNLAKFDDLLEYVIDFSNKYINADKNVQKIQKIYKEHGTEDVELTVESFVNLMTFTAMGAPATFKFYGESITRSRYTSITEFRGSTLIFQSITGLYETRYKLEDN